VIRINRESAAAVNVVYMQPFRPMAQPATVTVTIQNRRLTFGWYVLNRPGDLTANPTSDQPVTMPTHRRSPPVVHWPPVA
jgi:hypothetical protein